MWAKNRSKNFKKTCGVVNLRSSNALRRETELDYAQLLQFTGQWRAMIIMEFCFLEHRICFNKISVPFTSPLSVTVGHLRIRFHGEGHCSIADRRLHILINKSLSLHLDVKTNLISRKINWAVLKIFCVKLIFEDVLIIHDRLFKQT